MKKQIIILGWIAAFVMLSTLLSAQSESKEYIFEMPVSSKFNTAAFRKFIELPEAKRITGIDTLIRLQQNVCCPDCPQRYKRLVYKFKTIDNSKADSIKHQKLVTEQLCYGNTTSFKGEILSTPAVRFDTIRGMGKDTLITYVLSYLPKIDVLVQDSICFGEYIMFDGEKITKSCVRTKTLPGMNGQCDTSMTYVMKILPQPTKLLGDTILEGKSVVFNGEVLTKSAIRYDTINGVGAQCDTIVTFVLVVLPKPIDNRIHFFVEQTVGFEPGVSPINKDLWTSTHVGITVNHNRNWIWKLGLGWFPSLDFNIPNEIQKITAKPAPDQGWNDCNCDEKKQKISAHIGITYNIPIKKLTYKNWISGVRLSLTGDYAFGGPPIKDVKTTDWGLPGQLDFQFAFFTQRELKKGSVFTLELGPTLQFSNGSNHAGVQLRARFVMPTKYKK